MESENIVQSPVKRLLAPTKGFFSVNRTSSCDRPDDEDSKPPCDGAFPCEVMRIDRRYCDDPKKVPYNKGTSDWWYEKGSNHRVENGYICRDMGWWKQWFVEIPDVMEFVRKNGTCVVSIDRDGHESIEIYDDYRE